MNPKHLSNSNEHYTPPKVAALSRALLGRIDLDPASSAIANQIIRANSFFTEEQDGLNQEWYGTVFLNPPGGKIKGRKSSLGVWWEKLLQEYESGRVTEAIFVSFQLSLLRLDQSCLSFPFVVPRQRLRFYSFNNDRGTLTPQNSPTHDNAIFFLPNKKSHRERAKVFLRIFESVGGGKP